MSFVDHSKAWIVCDGVTRGHACENEFLLSHAAAYGWTTTGTAQHLCPNHTADTPDRDLVDVKARAAGEGA